MRCHCIDCRKFSGSTNTNNLLVSVEGFKILQGMLKTYTKSVETGNAMTSYFCPDCGSTLYRKTSHSENVVAVMIGGIDGLRAIEEGKPQVEIFTKYRPAWILAVQGAEQVEGTWLPKHDE